MDTSEYPSIAQIRRMNAQLAADAARVEALITAQLDYVERLVRAASNHDWDAVARASDALARQAEAAQDRTLSKSARAMCDALRRDPSGAKAERTLTELLGVCRDKKLRSR